MKGFRIRQVSLQQWLQLAVYLQLPGLDVSVDLTKRCISTPQSNMHKHGTFLHTRGVLDRLGIVRIVVPLDFGCVKQSTIWSKGRLISHLEVELKALVHQPGELLLRRPPL